MSEFPTSLHTEALAVGFTQDKNPTVLFENLDLKVRARELVCFMGPNGVGKSSLIRTLAGLQKAVKGKVVTRDAKQVAVVLTDKISAAHMTVYDLVAYGRYPYLGWTISLGTTDHHIINEAIARVHLEDIVDKKLAELSDGQLQMAMIAKALAQDTSVLLLDEPTAHLDLNNRVEIMTLLRSLARDAQKAIVVATHELDLALQTADKIWLATREKKIKEGMPEDLVLNGAFDDVFRFKGFDLKTGKVHHEAFRNQQVQLIGDGPEFLWTKNALERSGYEINSSATQQIVISRKEEKLMWQMNDKLFHSLEALLGFVAIAKG